MKTPTRLFHEALLEFNKTNKTKYSLNKAHPLDTKVPWSTNYTITNGNSMFAKLVGYVIEENTLVTDDEVLDSIATKISGMNSKLVPVI